MEQNSLEVKIIRGTTVQGEANWEDINLKSFDPTVKLLAAESMVKVYLTKLLQPVLAGTGMDTYNICDNIIKNLHLTELLNRKITQAMLQTIIFNEVYRICIQASSITNKDYAQYLNSQYIIDEIASSLMKLFDK